jgi:hypothetical protein
MEPSSVEAFLESLRSIIEAEHAKAPAMPPIPRLQDTSPVKRSGESARRSQLHHRAYKSKPRPIDYWRQLRESNTLNYKSLLESVRSRIYTMSNDARRSGMKSFKIDFNLEVGVDNYGRTVHLRDIPKKVSEAAVDTALRKSYLTHKFSNGKYTVFP